MPLTPGESPELLARVSAALGGHRDKLCSAAEAAAMVRPGDHVFIGTACATPRTLVAALEGLPLRPADVELVHFLTDLALAHDAQGRPATHFRHRSFFVGADMREAVGRGLADYVPLSVARVPGLMATGRIAVDVAFIQVSLPDEFGFVSLGVSVDVIPAAVAKARLVVAEINPAMPRSMGETSLHLNQIHQLVPVDRPVIEYHHAPVREEAMEQIARYIGGIIDDGSTLQIGLGRVTNEALKYLADRSDIGIHSDVITDAIMPLLEKGILTGRCKTSQPGKIVTSFAMGSRPLYDLIDGNPLFCFQPMEVVCNPATLASQHKMVSVTQAVAVDLTGQVCVDQVDGRFYNGLAAQVEFLQGASRSPGGKPIICLASTAEDGSSRIRASLQPGEAAGIARTDVHYVITEFGIAYLFGKSIRERAMALIEVAHPRHRAELFVKAQRMGYVPAEQTLKNMRAYPVEQETLLHITKGPHAGESVMLRPSASNDGDGIRDLFHRLSDRDRYTRFFRKVKGLSHRDVQRLCNVNFDNEVAFVAVSGTRENPQIVAQACYFTDPGTNLAETAFMVHPDWQGCGLGDALQRCMAEHARGRGVLGFVAEILASNETMIRLARSGKGKMSVEHTGGTVRVTTLF
ncbi:MAG: GNAT family N-acetyltransferase [Rubrivivax sp.]|nr:GNAT family N-acetyltransferase [Rubrivivax sp.]